MITDCLNNMLISPTRRRFVIGLATSATVLGVAGIAPLNAVAKLHASGSRILQGKNFNLAYQTSKVNFTGAERYATAINGTVPAPILYWKEGDTVTLKVSNYLAEDASIHWHGFILPTSPGWRAEYQRRFSGY